MEYILGGLAFVIGAVVTLALIAIPYVFVFCLMACVIKFTVRYLRKSYDGFTSIDRGQRRAIEAQRRVYSEPAEGRLVRLSRDDPR